MSEAEGIGGPDFTRVALAGHLRGGPLSTLQPDGARLSCGTMTARRAVFASPAAVV